MKTCKDCAVPKLFGGCKALEKIPSGECWAWADKEMWLKRLADIKAYEIKKGDKND